MVSKSWLIPILAMIMVIGMGSTAMAVPSFPDNISEHEPDCQHAGVVHFYATGITYLNASGQECVEGCRYKADGTKYMEFYEGSGLTTLKSWFRGNTLSKGWYYWDGKNFIPCRLNTEEPLEEEKEYIDYDTFKSEAPSGTVGVTNSNSKVGDLKVHKIDTKTEANQKLLADAFASQFGKRARILVSSSVYPRRELGVDDGKKEAIMWANLEKNPQAVYAVCYNQTDKAYYLAGTLDKNSVATLPDFILRPATNITIFVLE